MTASLPDVIAHRGASGDAPENTLAAFDLAWQQGADGIEGDFRLTRDGHIVCIHDAVTQRVCGVNLTVAETDLAELRRLDVGAYRGPEWSGQRIPTLQQVLETVPENKKIYVEVKCGPEIYPLFKPVVDDSGVGAEQVVFISFSKEVVAEAKKHFPAVKALWIVKFSARKEGEYGEMHPPPVEEIVKTLRTTRADGLDAEAHETVDRVFAETIVSAGFELHIWSKEEVSALQRFVGLDARSITTNYPGRMRTLLASRG